VFLLLCTGILDIGVKMAKTANVSFKEIARRVDVSIATVSRAMNGHKDVSPDTQKKVRDIAKKLGYRPNLLIQGIQTGKTMNIGVMVPPFDAYWSNVLSGIHDYLSSRDYAPITLWYKSDDVEWGTRGEEFILSQLHKLIDRRVDGVILWPNVSEAYREHLGELESRKLPVVTVDHCLPYADSVVTDGFRAVADTIQHLYKQGHRKIVHICGNLKWEWAKKRVEDFQRAALLYPDVDISVRECRHLDEEGVVITDILMSENRPTAICAYSDSLACTIYKMARSFNISIPDELSVVGFSDNSEYTSLISPPLTTIRQDGYRMGKMAAKVLIDRLEGKSDECENQKVEIPCEFVLRESVGIVTDK
jgi:LacI family transcriptional regulator